MCCCVAQSVSARLVYSGVFSLAFLLFCHQAGVLFILAIVAVNYAIGSALAGTVWCPLLTWTTNAVVLVRHTHAPVPPHRLHDELLTECACVVTAACMRGQLLNERYDGYRFAGLLGDKFGQRSRHSTQRQRSSSAQLNPPRLIVSACCHHRRRHRRCALSCVSAYLDAYKGVFGWHSLFNLVVLRLISFNMDRHWAVLAGAGGTAESIAQHRSRCLDCSSRDGQAACTAWRERQSQPLANYNPLSYFCYLFYVPLHFAGPTISFNAYMSYMQRPSRLPASYLLQYAARLLLCAVLLDVLLHFLYVFALAQPAAFSSLSLVSLSGLVYWTLTSMWLKFLVIWRFFRLFALLDGVECVENMVRCVNNHHSVAEFWREWHRAFNRWLIRYIYVPLGGNLATHAQHSKPAWLLARRVLNVFVVFSWVAYWHDRTMQLLAWGWLIALLFVPQLAADALLARTRLDTHRHYRQIRCLAAALNILLMMLFNMVGYSVGISGTLDIARTLADAPLLYWCTMLACFFAAAQVQVEVRAGERRKREALMAQLGLSHTADDGTSAVNEQRDAHSKSGNGWKEASS